jgi:hypothetical protein
MKDACAFTSIIGFKKAAWEKAPVNNCADPPGWKSTTFRRRTPMNHIEAAGTNLSLLHSLSHICRPIGYRHLLGQALLDFMLNPSDIATTPT